EHNRPDIASLKLQIDKAARDVHNEQAKAYPQLAPQLGYTRQFQQKAIGFPDANSWQMAATVSVPFSDRNQANIARGTSVLKQNTFNLEAALVELRAEIVQSVQEFQTAHRIATELVSEQLRLAGQVRNSIRQGYELGGRTLLE